MRFRKDIRLRKSYKLNKKAQEEIVGFVAIVILVSVVLVIFLGFAIRKDGSSNQDSLELYQFLESSFQFTTNCSLTYEPDFLILGELLQSCKSSSSNCLSGEEPCQLAEDILSNIISKSYNIQEDSFYKGYSLKTIYTYEGSESEILSSSVGDCSGTLEGAEIIRPSFPGTLSTTIRLCS